MPRYDDRNSSNTRLYVGHLSSRTRSQDLEHIFNRYGRVRNVDMKRDYAFVDFSDPRDADDARHYLDGRDVDGRRITVEFAKGIPRGPGGVREYGGRGPVPGTGRCFNCGIDGHWARDCRAGDWKNKCYRCGERGHIERNCPNSPKKPSGRSGRSYSRSPSPRRGRSRDRSLSRSRSYSRSRSPARRRRARDVKSPIGRSPEPRKTTPSPYKTSKRSLTPDDTPPKQPDQEHVYDNDRSKENDQSPSPIKEECREPKHEEGYIDSPDDNNPNEDGLKENKESPDEEDTLKAPEQDEGNIIDNSPKENKQSPSPYEDMKEEDQEEGYVENPKEMDDNGGGDEQSPIHSPVVEDDGNAVELPAGSESP